MRVLFRSIAWLVVILAVLVAILLATLNTSIGHGFLKQTLQNWVHPRIEVNGAIDLSIWPALALTADDLVVADTESDQPWLSVGQLRLEVAWRGLLSRGLTANQWRMSDVTIERTGREWQPLLTQMGGQGVLGVQSFKQRWQQISGPDHAAWHLQINEWLFERVRLVQRPTLAGAATGAEVLQPLASLERLVMSANLEANPMPVGEITVQAAGIRIEPDASEAFHAALEQVGLSGEGAWSLESLQSRWQLSDGVARADSLTAVGPWGDLSSSAGSIDLSNGQTMLPLRVQLKGDVSLQTRGIQIRTRQSDVSFVLSGPLNDLGIEAPAAKPSGVSAPVLIKRN